MYVLQQNLQSWTKYFEQTKETKRYWARRPLLFLEGRLDTALYYCTNNKETLNGKHHLFAVISTQFWHFPVLSNILRYLFCISRSRSSCPELSCKKGVPKDFEKFTGKHLCQSLFFNKIAGLRPAMLLKKRLWLRCFPVNFAKFLRTHYLQNISGGCLCLPATPRGIHIECSLYQILNSQTFLKCYKVRKYYVQNCLRIFLLLSTL